jgi:predicted membrane protein
MNVMELEAGRSAMAIFTFILIISGNYLGNLFPCRVQSAFENNMWLKHFLGYFTLLFFVLLTLPDKTSNVFELTSRSLALYLLFVALSNTSPIVWISVFVMYSFVYLIELRKHDLERYKKEEKKIDKKQLINNEDLLKKIQNYIIYLSVFITSIGFLAYMGEKKLEYKSKFTYLHFFFGNTQCRGFTKDRNFLHGIYHVLD